MKCQILFAEKNKKKYLNISSVEKKLPRVLSVITEARLFKYTENFTAKKRKFSDKKKSDIFHISAQNIDYGYSLEPPRRGGSNGYPQSMFLSRTKKNNVYPCKPQFYYIKVGFKGSKLYRHVFVIKGAFLYILPDGAIYLETYQCCVWGILDITSMTMCS